jgi:hypothetical protein
MIRTPALLFSSALLAAAAGAGTLTAAAAPADPVPHCQPFQLSEPSHTYNLRVCNSGLSTPPAGKEHQWVIDGSDLQSGAVLFGYMISSQQAVNRTVAAPVQTSADLTLNEAYFKASAPNGYRHVPQYYRRLIVVDDDQLGVPVEPVNWDVTASMVNPPAPLRCMILAGPKTGKQFRCTPLEQRSILDYWAHG